MPDLHSSTAVRFWGVRGSIPCPDRDKLGYGGNTSCVQVDIPDSKDYLILDSGSGIRLLGNEIVATGHERHGHIFITHAHWDHIQGFPFFRPIYEKGNSLSIHMPRQQIGDCKTVLTTQFSPTYFPVTVEMLNADIQYVTQEPELQRYKGYAVEFMLSNHPVETAAYKLHVGGKTLVYAPDNELPPAGAAGGNAFRDRFMAFIRGCDVLIHDANYDRDTYPNRIGWGHSAWEDVVEMAMETGVRRLFLTHHDPNATDEHLHAREIALRAYADRFDELKLAREGMVFSL